MLSVSQMIMADHQAVKTGEDPAIAALLYQ
jgi:hypothetical protein